MTVWVESVELTFLSPSKERQSDYSRRPIVEGQVGVQVKQALCYWFVGNHESSILTEGSEGVTSVSRPHVYHHISWLHRPPFVSQAIFQCERGQQPLRGGRGAVVNEELLVTKSNRVEDVGIHFCLTSTRLVLLLRPYQMHSRPNCSNEE